MKLLKWSKRLSRYQQALERCQTASDRLMATRVHDLEVRPEL